MSEMPTKSAELLLLCGKVRDNQLAAEDAKRLDALLLESDQAKALYVQYMSVVSLLESRGLGQLASASDTAKSDTVEHDVLAELLAMEQQADVELVHQIGQLRCPDHKPMQLRGALQWVIHRPAVIGSIAAALALALVLVVLFSGPPTDPPIAIEQNENTTAPTINHVVATLTAEHDAKWAYGKGALLGQSLHAGQSLILTEGFAEITTNRGAVAILEAPATIELLDNDNALRLHSGKIVGICEIESSKGFVVRTPHTDITDLGTEFGVEVTGQRVTATVFTGTIAVTPPGGTPQQVAANQTARLTVNGNNPALTIDQQIAGGFHDLREQQALLAGRLRGSGEGLALDTYDPNWTITAIDGVALDNPRPLRVAGAFVVTQPNTMAPSQTMRHNPTDGRIDAVYQIETTLRLPDGFDSEHEQLAMRFRADNELTSFEVNGQAVTVISQQTRVYGRAYMMVIAGPLKPGDNHLVFEVKNEGINNRQNPVGIQVAWELEPVPTTPME